MDIKKQQAYYQYMRQQQTYRRYAAGCGQNTPEPTFYNFKVSTENNPTLANLTITINGFTDPWNFNEPKSILSGETVEYRIECTEEGKLLQPIEMINGVTIYPPLTSYTNSAVMSADTTISVGFGPQF